MLDSDMQRLLDCISDQLTQVADMLSPTCDAKILTEVSDILEGTVGALRELSILQGKMENKTPKVVKR
jgi:hypothetical protein